MRVTLFPRSFSHTRHTNWFTTGFLVHKWCVDTTALTLFLFQTRGLGEKFLFLILLSVCGEEKARTSAETWCVVQLESNRVTSFEMIFVDCLINVLRILCLCTQVQISARPDRILFGCEWDVYTSWCFVSMFVSLANVVLWHNMNFFWVVWELNVPKNETKL